MKQETMKQETVKVLLIEPQKPPTLKEIPNTLKSFQTEVGGLIQTLSPFTDPNIILVCNDEGKILGYPLNRGLRHPDTGELYDIIAGNFFLCGDGGEDFISLTDSQIEKYSKLYQTPEMFLYINGNLTCLPMLEEESDENSM